jgi:hypothetical protein
MTKRRFIVLRDELTKNDLTALTWAFHVVMKRHNDLDVEVLVSIDESHRNRNRLTGDLLRPKHPNLGSIMDQDDDVFLDEHVDVLL